MNFVPCSEKIRRRRWCYCCCSPEPWLRCPQIRRKHPRPQNQPHPMSARPITLRQRDLRPADLRRERTRLPWAARLELQPEQGRALARPERARRAGPEQELPARGGAVGKTGPDVRHGQDGRQHGERWNWQRFQEYEPASSRETGVTQGRRDGEHPTERTDPFHQSQRHAHRARAQRKPPDREHA